MTFCPYSDMCVCVCVCCLNKTSLIYDVGIAALYCCATLYFYTQVMRANKVEIGCECGHGIDLSRLQ